VGRLANQLLSHATVIHRAEVVRTGAVDLREVAQHANADVALDLSGRDLTVRLDMPDTPVEVAGDLVALREAVRNLVENALQHGARTRVTLGVATTAEGPMLSVQDDGPGIAPADWDRLLERFETGGGGGTGLGLAIVADVARMHRARLLMQRAGDGDFGIALLFPFPGGSA